MKKSASEETKEDNESKDEDCDETKVDVVEDQKQEGTADLEGDKTEYESDDDVPLAKRGRGPTKSNDSCFLVAFNFFVYSKVILIE